MESYSLLFLLLTPLKYIDFQGHSLAGFLEKSGPWEVNKGSDV